MAQENAVNINRRPYLLNPDRPPEGEPRRMRDGETESEVAPQMKTSTGLAEAIVILLSSGSG